MKKILISVMVGIMLISNVGAYGNFYYGHCTWYVAKNTEVTWRGNAKDWIYNASIAGREIGSIPRKEAIVVFDGVGYNSNYGHVAIVEIYFNDFIIVSEMNYVGLGVKNFRKVSIDDVSIKGYIY